MKKDWGYLRVRALELPREDWKGPIQLAKELHISPEDAKALLNELEEKRLIWRDGPLAIVRGGEYELPHHH
jgi:DNA-binding MarR family transcriptional regulator